jgi:hypothetical protein
MDPTLTAAIVTAIVTVVVALIGYLITYWNNILLSQRTEQLNRINRQLSEFYGPLYSLVDAGNQAWTAFRTKYRSGISSFFERNPPPTDEDLVAWRLWITTVFMPRNLQLYELIVSKADLIIESDMPDCLRDLCAHVAAYQVVLKKWENGDFSEHTSSIIYPRKALVEYSSRSFTDLKRKQAELLGKGGSRHK